MSEFHHCRRCGKVRKAHWVLTGPSPIWVELQCAECGEVFEERNLLVELRKAAAKDGVPPPFDEDR